MLNGIVAISVAQGFGFDLAEMLQDAQELSPTYSDNFIFFHNFTVAGDKLPLQPCVPRNMACLNESWSGTTFMILHILPNQIQINVQAQL